MLGRPWGVPREDSCDRQPHHCRNLPFSPRRASTGDIQAMQLRRPPRPADRHYAPGTRLRRWSHPVISAARAPCSQTWAYIKTARRRPTPSHQRNHPSRALSFHPSQFRRKTTTLQSNQQLIKAILHETCAAVISSKNPQKKRGGNTPARPATAASLAKATGSGTTKRTTVRRGTGHACRATRRCRRHGGAGCACSATPAKALASTWSSTSCGGTASTSVPASVVRRGRSWGRKGCGGICSRCMAWRGTLRGGRLGIMRRHPGRGLGGVAFVGLVRSLGMVCWFVYGNALFGPIVLMPIFHFPFCELCHILL